MLPKKHVKYENNRKFGLECTKVVDLDNNSQDIFQENMMDQFDYSGIKYPLKITNQSSTWISTAAGHWQQECRYSIKKCKGVCALSKKSVR